MRIMDVGSNASSIEKPHDVQVSHDGKYWYVMFLNGQVIQKFRTSDNGFEGQSTLDLGQWSTMAISKDSRYAFVTGWDYTGQVAMVDLQTMTNQKDNGYYKPHGSAVSKDMN